MKQENLISKKIGFQRFFERFQRACTAREGFDPRWIEISLFESVMSNSIFSMAVLATVEPALICYGHL